MRRIIILLPVLLAASAVGFILYRGMTSAEALSVSSGAEGNYAGAAGDSYGSAAGDGYGAGAAQVPADIFYTRAVKSVVFSHQTHAVRLKFSCDTCHTKIFQMQAGHAESQGDFDMQGLAAGKYCGSCHSFSGQAAFAVDSQCARCHRGVKGWEREAQSDGSQED